MPWRPRSLTIRLTVAGATSGCAREDGLLLVFGSNAGADRHPGWYHNLLAHPGVEVEIGDGSGGVRTFAARARPLEGAERDEAYARQAARVPAYGDYQRATGRVIPVVALHPLDLATPDAARNRAIVHQLVTVHAALRAQLADLRGGGPAAADLAVHCLAFCDALGSHHATEDAVLPAFDAAFPELAPVLARLRAEDREVARGLAELRPLLTGPDVPGEDVRRRLDALAGEMERHFAYEEAHLLPALTPS
ncbi:nitroreductase/quinone reductase family protein [Actinacidiphila paucisporea]|nr:nitroreductase/quinone reductase family protein [Actinacidiphila paucisporea]